jgi:hypothetical protein
MHGRKVATNRRFSDAILNTALTRKFLEQPVVTRGIEIKEQNGPSLTGKIGILNQLTDVRIRSQN